jgi:hypothetical protein
LISYTLIAYLGVALSAISGYLLSIIELSSTSSMTELRGMLLIEGTDIWASLAIDIKSTWISGESLLLSFICLILSLDEFDSLLLESGSS